MTVQYREEKSGVHYYIRKSGGRMEKKKGEAGKEEEAKRLKHGHGGSGEE